MSDAPRVHVDDSASGAPPESAELWVALEALLRDLVRCLAPGSPALRVTVSQSPAADLTVRPLDDGFELLLVAGGDAAEAGSLLARVRGELEVVEHCGALVALHLEEGRCDSLAAFVRRVGLRYVQERVHLDAAGRAALFRRGWHGTHRRGAARCVGSC